MNAVYKRDNAGILSILDNNKIQPDKISANGPAPAVAQPLLGAG
jgi:hypothetical protein